MFERLRRSAIGFGVVMAAFTAYRIAAVPFIEPAVAAPNHAADHFGPPPQDLSDPVLSRIFPAGSWQLNDPPKLENGRSELLWQNYETLPNGWVRMKPCTIVFFPGNDDLSNPDKPLGRVITLDAP